MISLILQIALVQYGLASVYNDKIYACPKSSYHYKHLPVAAHRELPCGTIINIKRVDTGKIVRAVVGDRGPFGACISFHGHTRACGLGSKWINGRNFVKNKRPMKLASWRGILDMSIPLAKRLGVRNRLVPVFIWTDFANTGPSSVNPDELDDPKFRKNLYTSLEIVRTHENYATITQAEN